MAAQQHFLVALKCGHFYQVSAVLETPDGKPYEPSYEGKRMPSKCCAGDHTGTGQRAIVQPRDKPSVGPGHPLFPKESKPTPGPPPLGIV